MECVFCERVLSGQDDSPVKYYHGNRVAAFDDAFPLSPAGHRLVIPTRHVARLGDLRADEWTFLWDAVRHEMRDAGTTPDGFTVGVNDGAAAGQTVPHVHLHIIPRKTGDTPNARGGIRWVIPETADYWSAR